MLYAYLGGDDRNYQDYIDAATGRMLEVTCGGVYDVRVAPGRHPGLPLPPGDGRWGPASLPPVIFSPPLSFTLAAEPGSPPEPESVLPSLPGEEPPATPDGGEPAPSAEE